MDKEEVSQKVIDICEKNKFNLDENFRDKFAEKFVENYNGVELDADSAEKILGITLQTAYAAKSQSLATAQKTYEAKEIALKAEIEKLKANGGTPPAPKKEGEGFKLPEEIQKQLADLDEWKTSQNKNAKMEEVVGIAKKSIRDDLHASFVKYFSKQGIDINLASDEIAKKAISDFSDIFTDTIGDIKPRSTEGFKKRDEDLLKAVPKIKC